VNESDSATQGTICVKRRLAFQDLVRAYTVYIDEAPKGRLWAFQGGEFLTTPGHHSVRLAIGTSRSTSDTIPVEVGAGEMRVLRTKKLGFKKMALAPFGIFFPDRFAPRPWIALELEG
jgi:hypothetical protein